MSITSSQDRTHTTSAPIRILTITILLVLSTTLCLASTTPDPLKPPSVVFLNPGEPVDRGKGLFWPLTARLMGVAAKSFGIQLEVLYAERDHLLMLRQAESVAQRTDAPDYVIMVNEKQAAVKMLEMFADSSSKILLIHNDLTPEQRREIGNEREKIPNWIGTAKTDEERSTFRMMEELTHQLGTQEPKVLGITGSRGTTVSLERAQGVTDYISHTGRGEQLQLAFGNWGTTDAENKARVLLTRYPQTNIIWAANYSMALGALRAVNASGLPVLVGSTATAPQSALGVAEEEMAVNLGSHFFIGAWAMVLLHDYHHGLDFAEHGGVRQKLDHLYVIKPDNAARYYQIVYDQTDSLDFSVFSKYIHPSPGHYTFSLSPLMHQK